MKKKTILIIDDQVIFTEALKFHIQEENSEYEVITAKNGQEALPIVEERDIDLILLDIDMPVMDGLSFLKELRSRATWLPIIILSGIASTISNRKSEMFLKFGVVDYIEKPVNLHKLDRRIAEVLDRLDEYDKPDRMVDTPKMLQLDDETTFSALKQGQITGFAPQLSSVLPT